MGSGIDMRTLVLSDIHLGNGAGYDIFAGEDVLPGLLEDAAASRARVIFNGDSCDFLMNEDPLELQVDRAVAQATAIASHPPTAAVLRGLGRVLAAGGEVEIRLGNHDAELALPEVQAVFRAHLGQPAEVAGRLRFTHNDAPGILEVGGARILLAHGEHNDPWNRLDYPHLAAGKNFPYPPGSRLVKTLMNPLKRRYGMRFADLLKPDFQGAVLTAIAVDPSAVSVIFKGSTVKLLWQLFRRLDDDVSFDPNAPLEEDLGLKDALDSAGLTPEEREAVEAALDPDAAVSFGIGDFFSSAGAKLAKKGLAAYAKFQRRLTGDAGDRYFALDPDDAEWDDAQRLARKFDVDAVVLGHTHSARFRDKDGLTFVNTGTWIWLMRLPPSDAPDSAWEEFITQARSNPSLDPKKGPAPPLLTRFTGLIIDEIPGGGAELRLCEFTRGAAQILASSRLDARKT